MPTVAVTSGCSRTWTLYEPAALIGSGTKIFRRSISGPPAVRTASAMSFAPTEPSSRPFEPARRLSRTVSRWSWPATACASSRVRISRAERARLIRSTCFSPPRVHEMANPRGSS